MIGRLHLLLKRLSRRARLVAIAAAALVALNIVASALTPTSHQHHPTSRNPARPIPSTVTSPDRLQRQPSPVTAAELARVREAASRFLARYLPFAYGRSPARSLNAVTPTLRRQLIRERAQPTPVERGRHPRVVSLEAVRQAPAVALATAMIDDGGITTYPLRLRLEKGTGGWVVGAVDGG
jgi:hypothetical protein